jgi:hypothetical protein
MALSRPFRVEYFQFPRKRSDIVKIGHAATLTGALKAAVKTVQGDGIAIWCQIIDEYGLVNAEVRRRSESHYTIEVFK